MYLVPLCSSKLVYFFKFSFREIYFSDKFWRRLFFSIVNVWRFFTYLFLHEKTSIKNIKWKNTYSFSYYQFVSLIELKMQRLINYCTNTCKSKGKNTKNYFKCMQELFQVKVNKSVNIAKSRQRYYKPLNNILLHVSNHTLKDMYMLNYGTF